MDNFKDKTKRQADSAENSNQLPPDPTVQAKDDGDKSHDETVAPVEIVSVRKTTGLLPEHLMPTARGPQTGPSVSDMVEPFWRYRWMILAVFVLTVAPVITAIWVLNATQYRAKAELRIKPIVPHLVFRTEDNGAIPFYAGFVNTQVSVMRSPTVLQRVLDQPQIQQTKWYSEPSQSPLQRLTGDTSTPMERLRDALSVRPRRGTEITDVSFVAPSADDAKVIVDAILEQYMKYLGETSDETEEELFSQLVDRYKSLERDIDGLEQTSARLSESFDTMNPQELISVKRASLNQVEMRLKELERMIGELQWAIEDVNTVEGNGAIGEVVEDTEQQQKYHEDAEWRRLELEFRTLRHRITSGILKSTHPRMPLLKRDLEFAEESLRRRESQLDEQWINRTAGTGRLPADSTVSNRLSPAQLSITVSGPGGLEVTGVRAAFDRANNLKGEEKLEYLEHLLGQTTQQKDLLEKDLKEQRQKFEDLCRTARVLEKETEKLKHKTELYTAVRQRLDQKTMERQVGGSIEVLTWALASSQPYNDRRVVFTAMALVMGLGIGGGAAFLRANRSQTVFTPHEMPHPMQTPFLGYLPVVRAEELAGDQASQAMTESIRVVRTALLSRLSSKHRTNLLVTSAAPGTGKSTFTLMLAESLAKAGKKVLVIDADFHKMTLTKRLGLLDKPGFIQSLSRKCIFRQHVFPSETSGLSIVPAGKRDNGDTVSDEISNGAFKACLEMLDKRYQIVLLDGCPILAMADSMILSGQVDGTIVVERELVSRRRDLFTALTHLRAAGGRLLGTVFVGSSIHGKYGYGYGYGYGYHDGESEES